MTAIAKCVAHGAEDLTGDEIACALIGAACLTFDSDDDDDSCTAYCDAVVKTLRPLIRVTTKERE